LKMESWARLNPVPVERRRHLGRVDSKGIKLGKPHMSERAEAFMDKWLDENIDAKQLKRPEQVVAKMLARRCLTAARKAGVSLEEIAETVGDVEEAITDELRVLPATAAGEKRP
jgi:hypothetical protein